MMCETEGCGTPAKHAVYFTDPADVLVYCHLCGPAEYRKNQTAYAMVKLSELGATGIQDSDDLPEFEDALEDATGDDTDDVTSSKGLSGFVGRCR